MTGKKRETDRQTREKVADQQGRKCTEQPQSSADEAANVQLTWSGQVWWAAGGWPQSLPNTHALERVNWQLAESLEMPPFFGVRQHQKQTFKGWQLKHAQNPESDNKKESLGRIKKNIASK